jgi:hypothetical protein
MRMILAMAYVTSALACCASAQAATSQEVGMRIAQRRGHSGEKAQCYADVFGTYAALSPRRRWVIPRSRGNQTARSYRIELYRKCGIGA